MAVSQFFNGELYQRMSDDLNLTGKAQRTHDGYLRAVRKLPEYCKCSPDKISEQQLRRYYLHLKNDCRFASGSLRVAVSGIKFFYRQSCPRDWPTLDQLKVQHEKKLADVITKQQVVELVDRTRKLRLKAFYQTVYSLALRMNEALSLQVGDIDADRMLVHIHRGKGAKDRYIELPKGTLRLLRRYWKTHKHPRLLFPAEGRHHDNSNAKTPMAESTVQKPIKEIVDEMHMGKKNSLHSLRHSCATHLWEAGASLRFIQLPGPQRFADDAEVSAHDRNRSGERPRDSG